MGAAPPSQPDAENHVGRVQHGEPAPAVGVLSKDQLFGGVGEKETVDHEHPDDRSLYSGSFGKRESVQAKGQEGEKVQRLGPELGAVQFFTSDFLTHASGLSRHLLKVSLCRSSSLY